MSDTLNKISKFVSGGGFEYVTASDGRTYRRRKGGHGLYTNDCGDKVDLTNGNVHVREYSGRGRPNQIYFMNFEQLKAAGKTAYAGAKKGAWVETDEAGYVKKVLKPGEQRQFSEHRGGDIIQFNSDGTKTIVYKGTTGKIMGNLTQQSQQQLNVQKRAQKEGESIKFNRDFNTFYSTNKAALHNYLYNSVTGADYLKQTQEKLGIDTKRQADQVELAFATDLYNQKVEDYNKSHSQKISTRPRYNITVSQQEYNTTAQAAYDKQQQREKDLKLVKFFQRGYEGPDADTSDLENASAEELRQMASAHNAEEELKYIVEKGVESGVEVGLGLVTAGTVSAALDGLKTVGAKTFAKGAGKFLYKQVLPAEISRLGTKYTLDKTTNLSERDKQFISGLAGAAAGSGKLNVYDIGSNIKDYALYEATSRITGLNNPFLLSGLSGVENGIFHSVGTKLFAKTADATRNWGQRVSNALRSASQNNNAAYALRVAASPAVRFKYFTTPTLHRLNQRESIVIGTPFWQTENKFSGAVNNALTAAISGGTQFLNHAKGSLPIIGASYVLDPTIGKAMEDAGYGDTYEFLKQWGTVGLSKASAASTNVGKWLHQSSGGGGTSAAALNSVNNNWGRFWNTLHFNNYNGTTVSKQNPDREMQAKRALYNSGFGDGWLRIMFGDGVTTGNLNGSIEIFRGVRAPSTMANSDYAQAYKFQESRDPKVYGRRGLGQSVTFVTNGSQKDLRTYLKDLNKGYQDTSNETVQAKVEAYNNVSRESAEKFLQDNESAKKFVENWEATYKGKKSTKKFQEERFKVIQGKMIEANASQFQEDFKKEDSVLRSAFREEGEIGTALLAASKGFTYVDDYSKKSTPLEQPFNISKGDLEAIYKKYDKQDVKNALARINLRAMQEVWSQNPYLIKNSKNQTVGEVRGDLIIGRTIDPNTGNISYEYWNGDGHQSITSDSGNDYYVDVTGTGSAGYKHNHEDGKDKKPNKGSENEPLQQESWLNRYIMPYITTPVKTLIDQGTTHSLPILIAKVDSNASRKMGIHNKNKAGTINITNHNIVAEGALDSDPVVYFRNHDKGPKTWEQRSKEWEPLFGIDLIQATKNFKEKWDLFTTQ